MMAPTWAATSALPSFSSHGKQDGFATTINTREPDGVFLVPDPFRNSLLVLPLRRTRPSCFVQPVMRDCHPKARFCGRQEPRARISATGDMNERKCAAGSQ